MKPILFNTEMVTAILEGRKTVTRRVVKLPSYVQRQSDGLFTLFAEGTCYNGCEIEEIQSYLNMPFKVNDVLYVRETWAYDHGYYWYRAGFIPLILNIEKWKPSIHMPKEAARLFLRVTDIRVEKLRDITIQDILREGITLNKQEMKVAGGLITARNKFSELWNSTAGKKGTPEYYAHNWYGNPYVWVIKFEVISRAEALEAADL